MRPSRPLPYVGTQGEAREVTSDALALCFFALAGGAILFVIGEIWAGSRRLGYSELGLYMLGVGFLLGIATDLVVAYGGA